MKKYILLPVLTLSLLLLSTTSLLAQPGFEDDVTDTPIDGGVGLLIGAGLAYGIKRVAKKKVN